MGGSGAQADIDRNEGKGDVTDEKKPDPYEAMRLELDRARLEVERARLKIDAAAHLDQRTRTFLERRRTDVQPMHEAAERSRDMAFGFARMGIQTMVLLNGGALVAFPAFVQLVGSAFTEHVTYALLGVGGFVVGLVFVAMTSLLAYLSMDADTASLYERREIVKFDHNRMENPDGFTEDMARQRSEGEKRINRFDRLAGRFRWFAVGLALGSLVAFLVGAFFAVMVLSGTASASTLEGAIEAAPVVAEVAPNQEAARGGGTLMGLLTWTDNHQGAVVALATVVVAVASVASFVVAFFLARENRLLRKAGTEPEVVAYLLPNPRVPIFIDMVFSNIGQGPAKNLSFNMEGDAGDFEEHNVRLSNNERRKAISVLPQGERLVAWFGRGPDLIRDPPLKPFAVRVRYQNSRGRRYDTRFEIDITQFLGIRSLRTSEQETADAMKKIAENVARWSSRSQRLKVETITSSELEAHYREVEREWAEGGAGDEDSRGDQG